MENVYTLIVKKSETLLDFACQLCTGDHANICIAPVLVWVPLIKK